MEFTGVYIGIGFSILVNIVLIAYFIGGMKSDVKNLCKSLDFHMLSNRNDLKTIFGKCDSLSDKVSTIEGKLEKEG